MAGRFPQPKLFHQLWGWESPPRACHETPISALVSVTAAQEIGEHGSNLTPLVLLASVQQGWELQSLKESNFQGY